MTNLFRRLKAAMMFLRHYPVTVLPDFYWNDGDSKALSNFMTGDTGSKLRHIRFNRVYEAQLMAITDRKDSAFAAGVAFGVRAMVAEEDALLKVQLPEPEIHEQDAAFRSVNR